MSKASSPLSLVQALAVGTFGVLAFTAALVPLNDRVSEAVPPLLLLIPVVAAGALGGRLAAAAVAIEATLAFATGFLPPIGSPEVRVSDDVIALVLFVIVAGAGGILIASIVETQRLHLAADEHRIVALEQADRQRSALLRSVSHDLRTPLATIRAVATDLSSEVPFEAADRQELLGLVIDEVERLDRIVANLLSMSRIEAGSFLPDRQAVDVGELVEACTTRLHRVLKRVRLEVDIEPDMPLVDLDYSQFDQVLSNILENAARHSGDGALIRVVARRGPPLNLQVIDHGTGLAPEIRDRAFEPFASATGSNSSGVGLAICRSIVEAHGGNLIVSDTPGGGATFIVEVPSHA